MRKISLPPALIVATVLLAACGALLWVGCSKKADTHVKSGQEMVYHCPMHPNYLSHQPGNCPICGMKLVPVNTDEARGEAGEVKIDPAIVQDMGVATETVAERDLQKEIRVSGTIDLNETAISVVNTKIMGWVEKLYIDYTGHAVKKGQPLLTIYSPDLVSAQEEYLQAIHYLKSLPEGITTDAKKGAEQLVESGKRRLQNWDILDGSIAALEERNAPEKAMTIYSPSDGVVLEKMVVAGQNVMPGMALYKVADLSIVWALANVYQEDLPYVKVGTEAEIEVTSLKGTTFRGKIQFVSPVLDASTKTAAVRVAIRNTADRLLKPQMFANVTIQSPVLHSALSVSQQAVIHTGQRNVVIVSLGNGSFKPQEVTLGISAGGFVQVLAGLTQGQTIVTSSQFLIDSESNLKMAVSRMDGTETPSPTPEHREDTSKQEKTQAPQSHQQMNMPGM